MNESSAIRTATALAVLVVAAIAAVISYVHIQHLAVTHWQTPLAAGLLPVSIDGTVAAASLVMLRAARAGLGTPWLARFMLVLAVGATLAANVAYGLPYGMAGALLSGWPGVAFIGSAEMALGMVRRARQATGQDADPVAPGSRAVTGQGPDSHRTGDAPARPPASRSGPRPKRAASTRTRRRSDADLEAEALSVMTGRPELSGAELGRVLGVSERTGQRVRARLAAPASTE